MSTCPQCGRDMSNRGHLVRFCSKGCENAYKRENPDLVLGLIGKAIGGAISGAQDRRTAQAGEAAERRAEWEARRAQRNAEDLEEQRVEAEARAAASAARHVITHEVMCPVCDAEIVAKMASDGQTKVRCKQCKNQLSVDYEGNVILLGPKGYWLSNAEDLSITEDHNCGECTYYHHYRPRQFWLTCVILSLVGSGSFYRYGVVKEWLPQFWHIVGVVGAVVVLALLLGLSFLIYMFGNFDDESITCKNRKAKAVVKKSNPDKINPNCRCKFWKK